jgi:hypothetical protein
MAVMVDPKRLEKNASKKVQNASKKVRLTVTFGPRRFDARLG